MTFYELFIGDEFDRRCDSKDEALREAACVNKPWKIWKLSDESPRCDLVAKGDGAWKCTHHVLIPITRSALYDGPVTIGFSRFAVYVTPDGACFTEGAWNRGDSPDFRNTGAGVARGHGGPVLIGAQIIDKDN